MGLVKCVVPGCEDRTSPRHRIPVLDQELYEEWLKRIGNEELKILDPQFVGSNKRICSVHFSSHCRIPNSTKLKNRSLPTLRLPGFKQEPSQENSILKYPDLKPQCNGFIKDLKHNIVDFKKTKIPPSSQKVKNGGLCQKKYAGGEKYVHPARSLTPFSTTLPSNNRGKRLFRTFKEDGQTVRLVALNNRRIEPPLLDVLREFNQNGGCWGQEPEPPSPPTTPITAPCSGERCEVPTNIDFTYLIKIDSSLPDDSLFAPSSNDTCTPLELLPTDFPGLPNEESFQHSLYGTFEASSNGFPTVDLEELVRERCQSLLPETPSINS